MPAPNKTSFLLFWAVTALATGLFLFLTQNTQVPSTPTGLYVLGPDFFEDDYSNANGIAVQNNIVVENGYVRPMGAGGTEIDPQGPLGTGLKALWHLNGNANDSSGNGYNGSLLGNTICTASGKLNQACSFDGNGDSISLSSGIIWGFP